jgi:hypothetical protein
MAIDPAQEPEIKRLYGDLSVTLAEIGRRFACSSTTISRLAKRRGWTLRRELAPRTPVPVSGKEPVGRKALMARLCASAMKQLEQMEKGMASGEMSAADYERLAKSVNSMIGGMEKVAAVRDDSDGDGKAGTRRRQSASDVERMRQEIAERLERLAHQRNTGGRSGGSG